MATTYILECIDDSYYVGSTTDIQNRLKEHHGGRCKYTKSRLPVKLAYSESYSTLSEAKTREYQIKKWKSRKAIVKLILAPSSIG